MAKVWWFLSNHFFVVVVVFDLTDHLKRGRTSVVTLVNLPQVFLIASSNCLETAFTLSSHLKKIYSFRSKCTSKSTDLLKEKSLLVYYWDTFISIWQCHFNFNNRLPRKVWNEWLLMKNRYGSYLLPCNKLL